MNNIISIGQKKLPAPQNIQIRYSKITGQTIVTWIPLVTDEYKVYYNIYRSNTFNGIFYRQNNTPLITNRFIDNYTSKNPNVVYWYKISSVYQADGKWIEGTPSRAMQYQVNNLNKWFNKMNERNFWILKNNGLPFDYYQRNYTGERCECYDPLRGQASSSSCSKCYGTGFVPGYMPVCRLYVRLVLGETQLAQQLESLDYQQTTSAWTISSVRICNRDILIDPVGIIYSVLSCNSSNVAGYWGHQQLKLKSLDPRDPLYSMPRTALKTAY